MSDQPCQVCGAAIGAYGCECSTRIFFPPDAATLPAAPAPTEQAAKAIYRLFDGADEHPWVEGGNSTKQDDARRFARAALAARQAPTEQDPGEPYMFKLPGDHDWQLGFAPLPEGAYRLKLLVGAPTGAPKLNQQQEETITLLRMWSEAGHRDLKLLNGDRFGVRALLAGFDRPAPDSRDAALEEADQACRQVAWIVANEGDTDQEAGANKCRAAVQALKGPEQ